MTDEEAKAWAKAAKELKSQGLPEDMAASFLPHYYIPQEMQVRWHKLTESCQTDMESYTISKGRIICLRTLNCPARRQALSML